MQATKAGGNRKTQGMIRGFMTDHPTVSAIPTRLTPILFTAEYNVRRSTKSDRNESSLENRISIGKPVLLDRLDLTN
jgi:hypothetical protein